jgi:AcrR family transcriptional regulator
MTTQMDTPKQRMTASERRAQILEVAVAEFAISGLYGTSTETIARRAGVSQPYLFRLFGTKRDLFIAACNLCFDRVTNTFSAAAQSDPENVLVAMGQAYMRQVSRREDLLMQLQTYAACGDDAVRAVVSKRYDELFQHVVQLSGESEDRIRDFFAVGMLLNITLATGTERLIKEEWLEKCFNPNA